MTVEMSRQPAAVYNPLTMLDPIDVEFRPWRRVPDRPGIRAKELWRSPDAVCALVACEPGASTAGPPHPMATHHLWVIEGVAVVAGRHLVAGSYVHVPPDAAHPVTGGSRVARCSRCSSAARTKLNRRMFGRRVPRAREPDPVRGSGRREWLSPVEPSRQRPTHAPAPIGSMPSRAATCQRDTIWALRGAAGLTRGTRPRRRPGSSHAPVPPTPPGVAGQWTLAGWPLGSGRRGRAGAAWFVKRGLSSRPQQRPLGKRSPCNRQHSFRPDRRASSPPRGCPPGPS